jgi:hypothetical protein
VVDAVDERVAQRVVSAPREGQPRSKFTRFVSLGIIIAEDDVDLIPLDRGFVAVVVHADGEVVSSRGCLA